MSTTRRLAAVASVWFLGASSAFAHPGHGQGGGDFGVLHYLSEPAHLWFAIPLVLIVALGGRYAVGAVRLPARRRS
jgi:hypothetical protein